MPSTVTLSAGDADPAPLPAAAAPGCSRRMPTDSRLASRSANGFHELNVAVLASLKLPDCRPTQPLTETLMGGTPLGSVKTPVPTAPAHVSPLVSTQIDSPPVFGAGVLATVAVRPVMVSSFTGFHCPPSAPAMENVVAPLSRFSEPEKVACARSRFGSRVIGWAVGVVPAVAVSSQSSAPRNAPVIATSPCWLLKPMAPLRAAVCGVSSTLRRLTVTPGRPVVAPVSVAVSLASVVALRVPAMRPVPPNVPPRRAMLLAVTVRS